MKITINNIEINIVQAKLKDWLMLSDIMHEISKEKTLKNYYKVAELIYTYNSVGCKNSSIDWHTISWIDTVSVFSELIKINRIKKKFPIFSAEETSTKEKSDEDVPWTYIGRTWYLWAHLLASSYSWKISEIEELEVEEAVPLIQEILADKQLTKEFQWSMSEIAYPYNSTTKKSVFSPLHRPEWMKPKVKQIKKIKVRKDFVPVGNVIDLGKMKEHIK